MSLRARLRISIVAFVAALVIAISALYLQKLTRLAFEAAESRADLVAAQVKGYVLERIERQSAARPGASLEESARLWSAIIARDPAIPAMLERTLASADVVLSIQIADRGGRVLASSNASLRGVQAPPARSFHDLSRRNSFVNLWQLLNRRENYSTALALGVGSQPLFEITVVTQSVLLRHALEPALASLGLTFGACLVVAMFLASALPNVTLNPLERVSRSIDLIRAGAPAPAAGAHAEAREFAAVQSKLNLLGEQFQGARQDALELRGNVERLLQQLEEAVLLFDPSGRLMMAGAPAERLLGKGRDQIVGHKLEDLFPADTMVGAAVQKAVHDGESFRDHAIALAGENDTVNKVLVSVETMRREPGQQEVGTLVTLRDADTRRQLELQLDVSSRLAAISRLTSGVAHEIKNPLNAMALHLEVLRGKLENPEPEIDVIARELQRLDTVVKTFLNFNRPIELEARPVDLSGLAAEVVTLLEVDAAPKNIVIEKNFTVDLWLNGDRDLLKQAILNVVLNGMEAMQDGGCLRVRTTRGGGECQIAVADEGGGIPAGARDKIFNLYFTTKEKGTGIGLAMTFRVVQLHSGSIDFVSENGKGATFRLRFPELVKPPAGARNNAPGR